jgi:hypothetical protein
MTKAAMTLGIPAALSYLLVCLGCEPAAAQRYRPTQPVTFYAAPNGVDAGNNCLSQASPCTPQGAHSVALRDWDFSRSSCTIRLADGVYTRGVSIAGQYVGTHLCQVYGHVNSVDVCADAGAVVFDVPAGNIWDIQDGMMTSIACLTVQGENAIGFYGRQHVVVDLSYINCSKISQCISMTQYAVSNLANYLWVSDNAGCLFCASHFAHIRLANVLIIPTKPVAINYFAQSAALSVVEFLNSQISNPQWMAGSQCTTSYGAIILRGGLTLPCPITETANIY